MNGVVKGVYLCNQNRLDEINNRLYERNLTSAPVKMQYDVRAVPTRYVHMPTIDTHQETSVPCENKPIYNTRTMFTPANSLPFNGYQENIDIETTLHNTIFPIQACPQSKFIPSSRSDLYNSHYLVKKDKKDVINNKLLFKKETYAPFNPNTCDIGHKLFHNSTRTQIRNLN